MCFACILFFYLSLFAILKKNGINQKGKKKNSNFKFRILNFEFRISKFENSKKKKYGIIVWFYFHEPRSSQAIESLSWDPEPRPFQDSSFWAIESWFEPLSHDQSKPTSKSPNQIRATKLLSRDPSHRTEIRAKSSWAKIFELFFCYQTQRFHSNYTLSLRGNVKE